MAIKINSNKEPEYEDGQLKDALLSLVLSVLVAIAFFLLIFIAFPCLGFTAGQAVLIGSLVFSLQPMNLRISTIETCM